MNSNQSEAESDGLGGSSGREEKSAACWRGDLEASRDLSDAEKRGFEFLLSWFEKWRLGTRRAPGRQSATQFWREKVMEKPRLGWQLEQWGEAMAWYLRWLELCISSGVDVRTLPERLKVAVESAGARRGLARRTRDGYGSWAARFGEWSATVERARDPGVAREFLSHLVEDQKLSYSTQKQALCALAFFFKDVCGMEEVDLGVTLRKTEPRMPVVLDFEEVLALVEKLTDSFKPLALLQYASGLRRSELVSLRVKDIDLKRGTITVRGGKGDKDRVTVFPESLVKAFEARKAVLREMYDRDRAAGRPGVALPGALERKMPRAGERWEWFWWFPAEKESRDPESGVVRRHHIHAGSYGNAISAAARQAGVEKRVTSHALRHSFATHSLDSGVNLRTLQSLLGHGDVRMTEIYTHVSKNVGAAGIVSPLDQPRVAGS